MVVYRIILFSNAFTSMFALSLTKKISTMNTQLMIRNPFADRLYEGGPMMYVILICFLLALGFIGFAFYKRKTNTRLAAKMIKLACESSLLALVIGCLGSIIGVIQIFDFVESVGNVAPDLFSGGLKVSLLTITFGLFSFVIARIGVLIYNWTQKIEVQGK